MPAIPRDRSIDSTLALLAEGYTFISARCERLRSDVFETRLMLRRVTCAMGEDAAAMFYHPGRFSRVHAIPQTALMLLQDAGSAQQLEDEAHLRRKHLFLSLMTPERVQELVRGFEQQWQARAARWETAGEVVLHEELERLLCSAVCQWMGVPLTEAAVRQRAAEFAAMIEGAGAVGPRNWKGMLRRSRTEDWARNLIEGVRAQHISAPEGSPLQEIALHRGADGSLLDSRVATVELINLLRPTMAVARYITFSALAMHRYPQCRARLRSGNEDYLDCFAQEVRRFYPFFPAVGGLAREDFIWRGIPFPKGSWVLLDLYGTNHDRRIWGDPHLFRPERFRERERTAFDFIPQGGGDMLHGHRCAGEAVTLALMKTAIRLLTRDVEYDVPQQDLRISLSRMPAIPRSRFIIGNVRQVIDMHDHARVLRSAEKRVY